MTWSILKPEELSQTVWARRRRKAVGGKGLLSEWISHRGVFRAVLALPGIGPPGGTDSPHLCMGQDCLWDSEEQHRECNGMSTICLAPCCPRGSLVPYKNEDQISCAVHSQSCSSLSQRQSCPIQKWWASILRGSPYGENCVRDVARACKKKLSIFLNNRDFNLQA